ncbi:MAG: site-2 protease family protein [Candidatus Aminicenantes bacterium]|nr:site-2 protease family protein [Candidatus Aminicenantes bacterium]
MKYAWRIGRVFGIDIKVDSSWIVIFFLFSFVLAGSYYPRSLPGQSRSLYWILGLATSLLLFASVLAHELAHSIVAIRNGEKVRSITLFILGGVAQISEEPKEPFEEFSMAVIGPLSSFVLAAVFFIVSILLRGVSAPLWAAASYLAVINVSLAVFNLLPGFPMDGGRVLRAIIWKLTGDLRKATRVASVTGQAFAFLLIFVGIFQVLRGNFGGLWLILIGWFLHNAAVRGYEQVVVKTMLEGLRAEDLMTTAFETVDAGLKVQKLVDDYILRKKERVFLVTEGAELRGIVCLEDVKETPRVKGRSTAVGDVMTPREKLESVPLGADGNSILNRLTAKDIHQIPVMDGERIAGIICRSDVLKALQLRSELGV